MKVHSFIVAFLAITSMASAQNNPLWLRTPALSPDGNDIVFSYKGDLFKVVANGGSAIPLTLHEAYDASPVWSPDGKQIAFASDRYGNLDVFVLPSQGGEAKRLTSHSGNDIPSGFSPDGKDVLFSGNRNDVQSSARFPSKSLFRTLYKVSATGGRNILISSAGFQFANYDATGENIVFQDRKGYEDELRKKHTSSVTRDIWIYNTKSEKYTKISDFEGEDREPLFSSDGKSVYYLSEKKGSQNVFKRNIATGAEVQLTSFKDHPVRHLSRSKSDVLCFTWNGEIYTLKEGMQASKVMVVINADFRGNEEKIVSLNGGATEMALSPNGKEMAFVFRGEVFVTSTDNNQTKRITNTPAQERTVSWGSDSRTLFYATERGSSWDIYKATINRKEDLYFFASTQIDEEGVITTNKDEFQPQVSPNGKEIAYLEQRNELKIFNLQSKIARTIIPLGENFSYGDGDQTFKWSPDSKSIIARSAQGVFGNGHLVWYDGAGDKPGINVNVSGFADGNPQWILKGKALSWTSAREGKKPLAIQGPRETDVYAAFFSQEEYDRFSLSKEEFVLEKDKETKEKEALEKVDKDKGNEKNKATDDKLNSLILDFKNLENRKIRVTPSSSNITSYAFSPDGAKMYYVAVYEDKHNVWSLDTRTKEVKSLAKTNSGSGTIELSKDGKILFVLADGKITKIETADGKTTNVGISEEMILNTAGEREYIFYHAWRQVKNKFYDPKLHGVDWEMYRDNYARFLLHINNNYDFQELLSEILGELNGSHTGGRYAHRAENGDITASLGLFYDEKTTSQGLKITEVIDGGPLYKSQSKIKAGHVIEKIGGIEITSDKDWNALLNRKVSKNVLISMYDPANKTRWEETVKPIAPAAENALLYKRWTTMMRKMTDSLSGGKIGYVHVQGMNDGSFRTVFDEVLGINADKEGLIVDTRFNGGGNLHEDLSDFLDGKPYIQFHPYGFKSRGGEPRDKWAKPSVVLMSEGNYSDAHGFPYAYRAKGLGKLIGKPVAGTMTYVWWETQIDPTLVFGIPIVGVYAIKEGRTLENLQIEPDINVATPYEEILKGIDAQLKAGVTELLKKK